MDKGRCRLHGGKSTGPKTEDGKRRMRQAKMKHGFYTAEAIAESWVMRPQLRSHVNNKLYGCCLINLGLRKHR
jgi:hypothetical protein